MHKWCIKTIDLESHYHWLKHWIYKELKIEALLDENWLTGNNVPN
jgi:hypothetical protein